MGKDFSDDHASSFHCISCFPLYAYKYYNIVIKIENKTLRVTSSRIREIIQSHFFIYLFPTRIHSRVNLENLIKFHKSMKKIVILVKNSKV